MKFYRYISTAAALVVLLSGCSSDIQPEAPAVQPAAGECSLRITLRTSEPTASRSTWGEDYDSEQGYPMESSIGDVSFFLTSADNTNIELLPESTGADADGNKTYIVKVPAGSDAVKFDGSKYTLSGKIIVVANHPGKVADPFDNNPFSIEEVYRRGLIPMWGVATLNLELNGTEPVDAGRIYLLRAVPKISVWLNDEIKEDYEIIYVVPDQTDYLDRANTLPYGASSVSETKELDIEGCFNAATSSGTYCHDFLKNGTVHYWYTAERTTPNLSDGTPMSFTVTLKTKFEGAEPFTGRIYLCDYTDGKPVFGSPFGKLVRNHDYQYIINLSDLYEFEVDVIPFTKVPLMKPNFGMDRDDYTGYIKGIDKDGKDCWYDNGIPYYFDVDADANPSFKTINGKEYLLVYEKDERKGANLHHYYDKATGEKHYLDPASVTGYTLGNDMYLTPWKQRVWLDSGGINDKAVYDALKQVELDLICCRAIYEWDRLDWNKARWWGWKNVHPKYCWNIFGERFPWTENDTQDTIKAKIRQSVGEWAQYLE